MSGAGDGPAPRLDDEYKSFLAELGGGPAPGGAPPSAGPSGAGFGGARLGGPGLGMPGKHQLVWPLPFMQQLFRRTPGTLQGNVGQARPGQCVEGQSD